MKLTLGADVGEMDYKLVLTQYRDDASVRDCSRSRWMGWPGRVEGLGLRQEEPTSPAGSELYISAAPSTPPPTCKQPGLVRSLVATFQRPQN